MILVFLLFLLFLGCLTFNLLVYAIYLYEKAGHPDWDRRFYQVTWTEVRGFLLESLSTFVLILLWIADWIWTFARRWIPAGSGRQGGRRRADRPLILCHGYRMRGLAVGVLALWLRSMGRTSITLPTFSPATADIRHFAAQLGEHIRGVLAETGADSVDLVGHSMGGLIVRACLAEARRTRDESIRVSRAVTVGTPHRGTALWAFTWGACGLEMRPGSPFLKWLGDDPADVRGAVVYSTFDGYVGEESAAGWGAPAVRKFRLDGVGHVAMTMLPGAARTVLEALRD